MPIGTHWDAGIMVGRPFLVDVHLPDPEHQAPVFQSSEQDQVGTATAQVDVDQVGIASSGMNITFAHDL